MFGNDAQGISDWCQTWPATKDPLNACWKRAATVGGMFYRSLPVFTNTYRVTSLTRKQFAVFSYINVTNLQVTGIDSFTHSFVGHIFLWKWKIVRFLKRLRMWMIGWEKFEPFMWCFSQVIDRWLSLISNADLNQ